MKTRKYIIYVVNVLAFVYQCAQARTRIRARAYTNTCVFFCYIPPPTVVDVNMRNKSEKQNEIGGDLILPENSKQRTKEKS